MRYLSRAALLIVALMFASAAAAQPRPGGGGAPAGGGSGGAPAQGAGGLIVQFNAEQIAELFTAVGFNSQAIDNKVGDNQSIHMVRTQFWPNDNSTFAGVLPIWCKKDNPKICNAIDIFANLGKSSVDQKWINAWNNQIYFAHAYLLDNGSLVFSFHVLLQPGVTADYIKTAAVAFKTAVDLSTDFRP